MWMALWPMSRASSFYHSAPVSFSLPKKEKAGARAGTGFLWRAGGRRLGGGGNDAHADTIAACAVKLDNTVSQGEKRVIAAAADVAAGQHASAPLADDNGPSANDLTIMALYAQSF